MVNGMTGLAHRGFRLRDYSRHLANVLSAVGVETALCGVQHVASRKEEIGYERILDDSRDYFDRDDVAPGPWDRENAKRVCDFLREEHRRPFFLSFGLLSTHRPFPREPETIAPRQFPRPPATLPDTPATRRDMERFVESLETVDDVVGRVVDAVTAAGLWDDTAILLTTDHGPPFPGMKGTLFDAGIGVSLILRVPGIGDNGKVDDALVSQMDLFPTVCELFGIAAPGDLEGRSLIPLLTGKTTNVRNALFAAANYHANYEPARAIRTERFKLIRRYGEVLTPRPANVDDSPAKETIAEAGYFDQALPREQLVDLILDPAECRDFKSEATHSDVYRELAGRLNAWLEETGDPIRTGGMPRPKGTVLNRQDAVSAREPTVG
jgi:arylsulfatase A-like enzyme